MSILHHGAVINMNSGRKRIGCFIHEKHHNNAQLPRFAWWGHNKERRFKMEQTFDPVHGADGWQISNLYYYLLPYLASVEMFDEIGMDSLIEKKCYNLLFRIYFARNRQRGRKYF
jgi:kynureninase